MFSIVAIATTVMVIGASPAAACVYNPEDDYTLEMMGGWLATDVNDEDTLFTVGAECYDTVDNDGNYKADHKGTYGITNAWDPNLPRDKKCKFGPYGQLDCDESQWGWQECDPFSTVTVEIDGEENEIEVVDSDFETVQICSDPAEEPPCPTSNELDVTIDVEGVTPGEIVKKDVVNDHGQIVGLVVDITITIQGTAIVFGNPVNFTCTVGPFSATLDGKIKHGTWVDMWTRTNTVSVPGSSCTPFSFGLIEAQVNGALGLPSDDAGGLLRSKFEPALDLVECT